jgi:hypothetical protein
MSTVKTAISIDKDIYDDVVHMTKELHISKSQFFSQAAQYMIDRKNNLNLLREINTAYGDHKESEEEKTHKRAAKRYRQKRISGQWK